MVAASTALMPMHSAHLVGPYDWDPSLLPREEYAARLDALFATAQSLGLAGVIVHGNPRDNGALAYLTGLVPRMGMPAWAFLAPNVTPRLGVAGLPTPRQSWIEDMRLVRDLKSEISGWLAEIGASDGARIGLCGAAALTEGAWQRLAAGLGAVGLVDDRDGALAALRQVKSPRERALLAKASEALGAAVAALRRHAGKGAREAAIEAKRAGYAAGAQDVVVLASLHDDGTPLALDGTDNPICDPLHAWVAARYAGYWAQGLVTVSSRPGGAAQAADAALASMLAAMRPGVAVAEIETASRGLPQAYRPHALTDGNSIAGIGLSLAETPLPGGAASLIAGGIYSVRVGVAGADHGFSSAMVAVGDKGADILWRSAPGGRP